MDKYFEIQDLTAELAEWRKDAERLAKNHLSITKANQFVCSYCGYIEKNDDGTWVHQDTCPITLHRQLKEKYNITTRTRTNITTRSENAK